MEKEIKDLVEELERLEKTYQDYPKNDEGVMYYPSNADVSDVEMLAISTLMKAGFRPNWKNIEAMRAHGFSVYPGDKDSFGWITGCIKRNGRILVFG